MGSLQQTTPRIENSLSAIAAHPLRARCWTSLTDRTASPSELAEELGESLSDVSYHVKVLLKLGAIEPVGTRPVRGAVQHFYRSVERPHLSEDEFAELSLEERVTFARHICQIAFADAVAALDAQTFCERPEHHISRVPMQVDDEGWAELHAIYEETLERVLQVEAASVERMAREEAGRTIPVTALAMFFERPGPSQPPD